MDDKFATHARKRRERVQPPEKPQFFSKKPSFLLRRKIINSALACGIIALGVLGMSLMDTAFTNEVTEGLKEALNSELINDEDLGKLRLVDAPLDTEATQASAAGTVIPLDGEVVSTFSATGEEVIIKSEHREVVRSISPGLVVKTMSSTVVVENEEGTQTTYKGVLPAVKAGTKVLKGSTLGQLEEDTLTLTTVGSIGYMDPLSEQQQ